MTWPDLTCARGCFLGLRRRGKIIENAGLMGVPIPKALTGAIEILKQKSEQDNMEE